jgi:Zn-dependent protease with chaperone function
MKRIGMFLLVNLLVLTTIVIATTLLGVNSYLTASGIDYLSLLIFAAIIGFSGSIISLLLSKWMAKSMMQVKVLEPQSSLNYRERQLLSLVDNLARKAGLERTPEVGIYPSSEVNAFATGPSRNNSLVAVSSGLLERLDTEAVEGVLAHEVAHIANGDMVTMTLLQGVVNTFVVFLSRIIAYVVSSFKSIRSGAYTITSIISTTVSYNARIPGIVLFNPKNNFHQIGTNVSDFGKYTPSNTQSTGSKRFPYCKTNEAGTGQFPRNKEQNNQHHNKLNANQQNSDTHTGI